MRDIANEEIDGFSREVLGWDRDYHERNPGQRRPGDILRDFEDGKVRLAKLRQKIGAAIMFVATIALTTALTAAWPTISAWIWKHI